MSCDCINTSKPLSRPLIIKPRDAKSTHIHICASLINNQLAGGHQYHIALVIHTPTQTQSNAKGRHNVHLNLVFQTSNNSHSSNFKHVRAICV